MSKEYDLPVIRIGFVIIKSEGPRDNVYLHDCDKCGQGVYGKNPAPIEFNPWKVNIVMENEHLVVCHDLFSRNYHGCGDTVQLDWIPKEYIYATEEECLASIKAGIKAYNDHDTEH